VFWALLLVTVSFWARGWGELLEAGLTISGLTMGSILALFILGILRVSATSRSVIIGMVGGVAVMIALHWSGIFAWTWYVLLGTSTTLLLILAAEALNRRFQIR